MRGKNRRGPPEAILFLFFFFVESFFTVNIHSETAEEPFEHRKGGAAS